MVAQRGVYANSSDTNELFAISKSEGRFAMKYLVSIVVVIFLAGCSASEAYHAYYDIGLLQVEHPADMKARYGEQKITRIEEEGTYKYCFEDDIVKIIWIPTAYEFDFVLTNKSRYSIKIIWDEAAFVDENGLTHRIMHSGVRYIERDNPQPPTVIPSGATIADLIFPTDYVYWASGTYGGWRRLPLLPVSGATKEELSSKATKYVGKTYKVLLPLTIEGVTHEYVFTFKIIDVKVKNENSR